MNRSFPKGLSALLLWGFFLSSDFAFTPSAYGSACCGRNAATPVLIVGDDRSQLSVGVAQSHAVAWADETGTAILEPSYRSEILRTYRLDAATLLSDRWQMGFTVPVSTKNISISQNSESTTGLGDLRVSLGYEAIPAWTYSFWKPQMFLFATFTVPTGRSVYDSTSKAGTDAIGNGAFSTSLGSLWVKRWNDWDLFLVPEAHYSFARQFELDGGQVLAQPGWGGSLGLGAGWSPGGGVWRMGLRLQPRVDEGVTYTGLDSTFRGISNSGLLTSCDTGVDLNYMIGSSQTLTVSYTDQTLLGVAMNSYLNRVLAVSFQHRWER